MRFFSLPVSAVLISLHQCKWSFPMNTEKYTIVSDTSHIAYEFLSEGPKGTIRKFIFYEKIGDDIYNLSFGDWAKGVPKGDDRVRSNNNDRNKVLLTVASTVFDFLAYYPDAIIIVKGSTASRTRLYQMGITANLDPIRGSFTILGLIDGNWQSFEKGRNYSSFSLAKKALNLGSNLF